MRGTGLTIDDKSMKSFDPTGPKKKAWRLPIGFGYRLYLEFRFMSFILISIAIYSFGALCANEWLYLLASSFLCAACLGLILPLLMLFDIEIDYSLPDEVLSSEEAAVIVKLTRGRLIGPLTRFISSKWIRLTIDVSRRGKDGKTYEKVLPPEPVLIESLADEKWFEFPTPLLQRGIYKLKAVELSSCFPFGIVWWSRIMKVGKKDGVSITVYPRVYPMAGNFLPNLSGVSSTMGMSTSSSAMTHQSTSFRSVREYKSGDSLRHIHWPLTAKASQLLVKEFDKETIPVFNLMLNLRANWRSKEQFELAVASAISLCHLGFEQGQLPSLVLVPPLRSKQCHPLMHDLPTNVNPGLELYSEILARVEPITASRGLPADDQAMDDNVDKDEDEPTILERLDDTPADRDMLTILPSMEKVMKYKPDIGDVVCEPVELTRVQEGWDYEEPDEEKVRFSKMRPGGDAKSSKKDLGPTEGEVMAVIEWEADLKTL